MTTLQSIVPRMREDIAQRRAELAPLIAEDAKLAAIEAALADQPRAAAAPRRAASPRRAAYAAGARRAPRGANRAAILKAVEERPGITAGEVAEATQIAKATVHTTVSQLKRKGILRDTGGGGVALAEPR